MKGNNGMDHNKNSQGKHLMMNGNHELHLQGDGVPNPRISLYPQGKVHLEWKQIHKIGAGLANLGNTCFMNTVIQCLTYCPPLVNYLLHDDDHSKCKISGFCMMCELQKHIKRALDRPGDVIKPLYIYQKLKSIAKHFQFGRQEDAHEFLRYVVDNLWKASLFNYDGNIKLDPASKETTVINHIFGGYHRSQVICLRCKEKSNTYDHFMDFILDIKQNVQSLEKALEKFIQPELLQNENAYKCPRCNMKVSAQKRFTVHRPPNVATFQFKRFDYNRMFGGKITKHVSYPEKLDLRPYMSDTKGGPVIYRLNAVLVHLGPSCNSGHYFCYVRNSNGYWYLMDDARVHQVSVNQVLNQQAYVLFYIRVAATSSNHLKKSPSAVSTNHKISEGIKNGVLGHLPNDSSASSISKSKSITKTTSSPAIIRVSSSSSSLVNGNAYGVSPKLSLPQNREKVIFGIRRPEPGMKTLVDKSQLNHNVKYNSSVSNNSGHACLVPYAGDSSESSDDEHRKIKSKTSNYKNSAKSTHETSKSEATSTVNSDSCKNKIDLKEESKDIVGQKSEDCVAASNKYKITNENFVKKSSVYRTSSPSVTPSDSLQVTTKVKSTFPWHVSDASLHSPSVASGSSTNSVNSTADWTVTDQENINRNKIERTYTGWTITQNEKSSNEQTKTKGPSTHHKDTTKKSLSNSNNSECSELLNKSEVLVESSSNGNTSVLNDAEESPTKTKTNEDLQYCTNKSSSSKSSELFDVDVNNFKSENEQSFQDHAVSKENSFLKSGKKRKSIDSEKGKFQESSSKRTSSSASSSSSLSSSSSKSLISDIHKSTSSKWESKFFDNDETSYYPMSKKCKSSYNEHEERKEGYRYKKRIDEKWKSKKKYSKHSEDFWQAHKSYRSGKKSKSRKYDHREMQNNYYNSSFNARNERHYSYEGNHYKEKFNSELQNSITHHAENTRQKANVKIKHKNGLDKSLLENSWDKKYLKQKKHLNYKSGDSDNSSCSYEMEWVEKTKETVEAEQKTSKSYNVPSKYWDSDVKDGFTQKTNDHNSNHNKYWNGRERNEIVKELQKYSSKGYGEGVNSWDGNRSHLEREVMEDSLQKRDHYDDYNEEYDRGKVKKIKKWHGNSKRMYSYNPFQKAWDSKKYEKYEHHSHRHNKHFHNRKFFNNHHHQWNYSKYSNATVRDKIQD
ncbi:ubiquitin carboxyl-terminal hydrolase 36 isoform X2 [Centruroides vittatus]